MNARTRHRLPPEGALLRLLVTSERWAEDLPPVPEGFGVTVTFSDELDAAHHGPALELLGYRIMGVQATGHREEAGIADILVSQQLLEAHPTWWRALADLADRAFSLALGPVLASLAPVLQRHQPAG